MKNFLKFFLILLFVNLVVAKMKWDYQPGVDTDTMLSLSFNEGSGTTVNDNSGNNKNGTITGAPYADGKWETCLDFGVNDTYVAVPDAGGDFLPDAMSVFCWIYPENVTGYLAIIERGSLSLTGWHFWQWGTGHLFVDLEVSKHVIGTGDLVNDTWHYAGFVFDGSAVTLYLNGLPDGSNSTSLARTAGDALYFGIRPINLGSEFDGKIEGVVISSRTFTAAEVLQNYNEQCGGGQ